MAIQAYNEWMPIRLPDAGKPDRIYRSFDFGNLLSLHMLDTRIIGRDKQLGYASYVGAGGAFNGAAFAADVGNPARQLMGADQSAWLTNQMSKSSATWQMLGQQVLMARMNLPAPLVLGAIGFGAYVALVAKAKSAPTTLTVAEQQILAQPSVPYNLDAWDGYQAARETVLATARALNKNLVVLAGDTHNAWASDLADMNGQAVGVEFGVSSVTSPGFEEIFKNEDPALMGGRPGTDHRAAGVCGNEVARLHGGDGDAVRNARRVPLCQHGQVDQLHGRCRQGPQNLAGRRQPQTDRAVKERDGAHGGMRLRPPNHALTLYTGSTFISKARSNSQTAAIRAMATEPVLIN